MISESSTKGMIGHWAVCNSKMKMFRTKLTEHLNTLSKINKDYNCRLKGKLDTDK